MHELKKMKDILSKILKTFMINFVTTGDLISFIPIATSEFPQVLSQHKTLNTKRYQITAMIKNNQKKNGISIYNFQPSEKPVSAFLSLSAISL